MGPRTAPAGFLAELRTELGSRAVLTDPDLTASYTTDWTGRFRSDPPTVVRPADADGVDAGRRHAVALVPRGGNTGLVGATVALDGEVIVDLGLLRGITDLDPMAGHLDARAGTTIAEVHAAAHAMGWAYGVDWAARDTATIGGSVATNAGGIHVIRHGDTRAQIVGVAAVLGNGDRIDHRPSVDKDNTGLHLGALLCGSEGTLGLVTDVRVRLIAPPGASATALIGFSSPHAAVAAAVALRRALPGVSALEFTTPFGLDLVAAVHGLTVPLTDPGGAQLLVEVESDDDPAAVLIAAVADLAGITDTAIATDSVRRHELWRLREAHTTAIATLGTVYKFDLTLPLADLSDFVEQAENLVRTVEPDARTIVFGHAGDGNVHVNVTGSVLDPDRLADTVLRAVAERGGSISAEHGMGRAKHRWFPLARSADDLAAMRAIRAALDPDGICNPAVAP